MDCGVIKMQVLSRERRLRLRDIARQEYYIASKVVEDSDYREGRIKRLAVKNARQRLKDSREYGGFLNALLLSIAIKLITKLIEHWIDEKLSASELGKTYKEGEPGYE